MQRKPPPVGDGGIKMAYTPGPWEAITVPGKHALVGARANTSDGAKFVALCGNHDPDDGRQDERFANARLIAAAPELLAAAQAAIAALSQNAVFPADIAAAKKWLGDAIAKANGY